MATNAINAVPRVSAIDAEGMRALLVRSVV